MSISFQDTLTQMVKEHGVDILDNAIQCRTVLNTYIKDAFKRESRLFLLSIEAGCHRALLGATESEAIKHQLIQRLKDEYGITTAFAEEGIFFLVTLLKDQEWYDEKVTALKKAAQQGDYQAKYELGLLFEKRSQYETSIYWFKAAAKQGLILYQQSLQGPPKVHSSPEKLKKNNSSSDSFVLIKGGTFIMGSPLSEIEREDNEIQHPVKLNSFYLGKHQITQQEYEAVMGTNPSYFKGDNLPVECVSWYDTIEYCNKRSLQEGLIPMYAINKTKSDPNNTNEFDGYKWIISWNWSANGYRLPTEAEWEYACRAGTSTPYYTGSYIIPEQAHYDRKENSPQNTIKVGSFSPNPWGLYDMYGNVFEWCWDWYGSYSRGGTQIDPLGAPLGTHRVLRGGSWNKKARTLRSAYRVGSTPALRSGEFGFRVIRADYNEGTK